MNTKIAKFVVVAACAASFVSLAQESVSEEPSGAEIAVEENSESPLSVGVDVDFLAGYVWRSSVSSDDLVIQPAVWAELEVWGPFSVGGFVWENYDLTGRRRGSYTYGLTETDYNVHLTYTAWESEDECENACSLSFEFGHDWFTYHGAKDRQSDPDTREIYLKGKFENPIITPYAQISWMYEDFGDYRRGVYYEVGFNKEVEVSEIVSVGADWSVGFGDHNYNEYLFGYDSYGFGGTTVKVYSSVQLTDWVSLKGTIGYTGVLNGAIRKSIGEDGDDYDFHGSNYPRDLLWGGVSLNFEF